MSNKSLRQQIRELQQEISKYKGKYTHLKSARHVVNDIEKPGRYGQNYTVNKYFNGHFTKLYISDKYDQKKQKLRLAQTNESLRVLKNMEKQEKNQILKHLAIERELYNKAKKYIAETEKVQDSNHKNQRKRLKKIELLKQKLRNT